MNEQLYRVVKASERLPEVFKNYHVMATQKHQGYNHVDSAIYNNGKWEFQDGKDYEVVEWLEPLPLSLEGDEEMWIAQMATNLAPLGNDLPTHSHYTLEDISQIRRHAAIAGATAYATRTSQIRAENERLKKDTVGAIKKYIAKNEECESLQQQLTQIQGEKEAMERKVSNLELRLSFY